MSTKIIGNQIDATTRAIMEALDVTEQINLPALNQSAINALGTPAYGTLVYNSTEDMAQIYLQDAAQGVPGWDDVGGGGPSVGEESIIRTNGPTIEQNITVGPVANGGAEFTNGFTAGPVTIANGYTVTVENNATWQILGDDADAVLEYTDIATGTLSVSGILHFTETKEAVTYYNSSGTVTHSFNNNNTIWVTKTGGGNFTFNLNDVPSGGFADGNAFGITVIIENAGGAGRPSTFNINGTSHTIYWAGGGAPSMSDQYMVCSFAITAKQPAGQSNQSYTVFGSAGQYG